MTLRRLYLQPSQRGIESLLSQGDEMAELGKFMQAPGGHGGGFESFVSFIEPTFLGGRSRCRTRD
jgi:hypothetical protein